MTVLQVNKRQVWHRCSAPSAPFLLDLRCTCMLLRAEWILYIVHSHQEHDSKLAHNLPYPVERGPVLLANGSNIFFLIGLFDRDLQQSGNLQLSAAL